MLVPLKLAVVAAVVGNREELGEQPFLRLEVEEVMDLTMVVAAVAAAADQMHLYLLLVGLVGVTVVLVAVVEAA